MFKYFKKLNLIFIEKHKKLSYKLSWKKKEKLCFFPVHGKNMFFNMYSSTKSVKKNIQAVNNGQPFVPLIIERHEISPEHATIILRQLNGFLKNYQKYRKRSISNFILYDLLCNELNLHNLKIYSSVYIFFITVCENIIKNSLTSR